MKVSRAVSFFIRAAAVFLVVCLCLLFTAAAIELKHAPTPGPDDQSRLLEPVPVPLG